MNSPDTLNGFKIRACVRSGFCCKRTPCGFGAWDSQKNQCKYLVGSEVGHYSCGKYDDIVKDPTSYISPAFGFGCSSAMNTDRVDFIKRLGREVFVDNNTP